MSCLLLTFWGFFNSAVSWCRLRQIWLFYYHCPFLGEGGQFSYCRQITPERQEWEEKLWAPPVTSKGFTVCLCLEGLIRGDEAYLYEKCSGRWHFDLSHSMCRPKEGESCSLFPPPPPPPRPLPVPPHQAFLWQHHASFMPSIFRIIPNLIAVSLLLPAAAAPKIKSHPTKGMLGWSLLIDQMLCCSKNSGHQVPSEA